MNKDKVFSFKRYCKSMEVRNDSALIEAYKKAHAKGATWPEITQGMKEVGIIDMEIYLLGTKLFMIMDIEADFDHDTDGIIGAKASPGRMGNTNVSFSGYFCRSRAGPKMATDGADL